MKKTNIILYFLNLLLITSLFYGCDIWELKDIPDECTGEFESLATPLNNKSRHKAILINNDNEILIVGGISGSQAKGEYIDIYNISSDSFRRLDISNGNPWGIRIRLGATATKIDDNKVIITGGTSGTGTETGGGNTSYNKDIFLYDGNRKDTLIFKVGDLQIARSYHSAIFLQHSNELLIIGGDCQSEDNESVKQIEKINLTDYSSQFEPSLKLKDKLWNHTATLLTNDKYCDYCDILIVGGRNNSGQASRQAYLLNTRDNELKGLPDMNIARGDAHTATYIEYFSASNINIPAPERVLIIGGNYAHTESDIYDVANKRFLSFDSKFSLPKQRVGHTATKLSDNRVAIIGGEESSDGSRKDVSNVLIFKEDGLTVGEESLIHPRAFHTATFIGQTNNTGDRTILIGGNAPESELFYIESNQ